MFYKLKNYKFIMLHIFSYHTGEKKIKNIIKSNIKNYNIQLNETEISNIIDFILIVSKSDYGYLDYKYLTYPNIKSDKKI